MAKKPTTGLLIAGAAGLAAFLFLGKKKAKAAPAPFDPQLPEEPDAPTPAPPKPQVPPNKTAIPTGVVGGGWSWPEQDKWPHEGSIGHSLMVAGYAVDGNWAMGPPAFTMTTSKHQSAVKKFQRDYNTVQKARPKANVCIPGSAISKSHPKSLGVDGWIGPNTWKAMRWVFKYAAPPMGDKGISWPELIKCAKEMA